LRISKQYFPLLSLQGMVMKLDAGDRCVIMPRFRWI